MFSAIAAALWRTNFLRGARKLEGLVVAVEGGVPSVQIMLPSGPRTIRGAISSEPPSFVVGERVPVYFTRDTAEDAVIGSFIELWFAPVLIFGIGTPFGIIGAGFLLFVAQRTRRDEELRATGRKLSARVVAMENSRVRINRRPAKILVAQAQGPRGDTLTFRSDSLLCEEHEWLGKDVTVYVDRGDPRRYAVMFDDER